MNSIDRLICSAAAVAVLWTAAYAAPSEMWRKFYTPTNATDDASSLAVASDGSIWVAGSGNWNSNLDVVLLHYDVAGNLVASTHYDRAGNDDLAVAVKIDPSGNVIVLAQTKDATLNQDITVIKYSSAGSLLWVKNWDGSGQDTPQGLAVDSSGNIYVAGTTTGSASLDCVTLKYLPDGTLSWAKTYNGTSNLNDELRAITVSSAGFVYVCGYSRNLGSQEDFLAIKYTLAGTQVWAKTFDGPPGKSDIASAIACDSTGLPTISGPSTGTGTDSDMWTIHLDANGNIVWQARKDGGVGGGDNVTCIAYASDDSLYVAGKLYTATKSDMGLVKYDNAGNELWTQTFSQSALVDVEEIRGIAVDAFDNVYVTGVSMGLATLEYSPTGSLLATLLPVHSTGDRGVAVGISNIGRFYVVGNWSLATGQDNIIVLQYALRSPVTGTLYLDLLSGPYPTQVSVDVRPTGSTQVIETDILNCDASGNLSGSLPQGKFDVSIKYQNWLRRTLPVVANGTSGVFSPSCNNGDATPDNVVNLLDLSTVLAYFGMSQWSDYPDLNHDNNVGLSDLSTVLLNYSLTGDQ